MVGYLAKQKPTWALKAIANIIKMCEGTAVEFGDAVGTEAVETQGMTSGTWKHQHRAPERQNTGHDQRHIEAPTQGS